LYDKEVITRLGYNTVVFISAPVPSPRSSTALGYVSGSYRHSGLIYGP